MASSKAIRVFISYAHEQDIDGHRDRALSLAESLRIRGVVAWIDQYIEHDPPPSWPRWMADEIKAADYVLCLASPAYKERVENRGNSTIGRGAKWEGMMITEQLYENMETAQKKYISVVLDKCSPDDIPDVLLPVGRSYYLWPQDDEDLYRRLTGQPRVVPAPLGEIVLLPAEAPPRPPA